MCQNFNPWTGRIISQLRPVTADVPRVPVPRVLDRPLLRLVIDVNEAETLAVAVSPLEVVHQRPVEITADVHAIVDRATQLAQIPAGEVDSLRVVHRAVE